MLNLLLTSFLSHRSLQSKKPQESSRSLIFTMGLVLCFMGLPSMGFAQTDCPSINVKIENISNNTGVIACAIFDSAEGFPGKFLKFATKIMITQINQEDANFEFSNILPGKYAIAVIHDENRNGELDTNMLGIPTEGKGFSSGAEVSLSAPSFADAEFTYDGGTLEMSITLDY